MVGAGEEHMPLCMREAREAPYGRPLDPPQLSPAVWGGVGGKAQVEPLVSLSPLSRLSSSPFSPSRTQTPTPLTPPPPYPTGLMPKASCAVEDDERLEMVGAGEEHMPFCMRNRPPAIDTHRVTSLV